MPQKIILASSSVQRQSLMRALNIPFEIIPAEIDEQTIRDRDLSKQAEKIARAKAEAVSKQHKGIIIAGDTFTVLDGNALEKPKDVEEARQMLRLLSGKKGVNHNGFCYLDKKNNINYSTTASAEFRFRELSQMEIDAYVSKFPVTTWAAAFSPAYIYVMTLIAEMKGTFTGFSHGLPIEILVPLLKKSGFGVHP
ncbi:MAG: Maf family protein [bacterium]|nr:Maf family protein [bacterium]